jgi:hypothetical protein
MSNYLKMAATLLGATDVSAVKPVPLPKDGYDEMLAFKFDDNYLVIDPRLTADGKLQANTADGWSYDDNDDDRLDNISDFGDLMQWDPAILEADAVSTTVAFQIEITGKNEFKEHFGRKAKAIDEAFIKDSFTYSHDHAEFLTVENVAISFNGKKIDIEMDVSVSGPATLMAKAHEAFSENFGGGFAPNTFGEAVFEILCASNPNPSPDEIGFSFCDYSTKNEVPVLPVASMRP